VNRATSFSKFERGNFFVGLVSAWQEIGFAGVDKHLNLWSEALHIVGRIRRGQLLRVLGVCAPLIAFLGGEAAIGETLRAMRDASQWWASVPGNFMMDGRS
jgi:hypothetical protein